MLSPSSDQSTTVTDSVITNCSHSTNVNNTAYFYFTSTIVSCLFICLLYMSSFYLYLFVHNILLINAKRILILYYFNKHPILYCFALFVFVCSYLTFYCINIYTILFNTLNLGKSLSTGWLGSMPLTSSHSSLTIACAHDCMFVFILKIHTLFCSVQSHLTCIPDVGFGTATAC